MGVQQSKDAALYEQVNNGNIEGIKALRRGGAGLEWTDRVGRTPLIVACMSLELYGAAKTLIELGADINAYRRGRNGGTPLHHAAKRGLEQTVKLLLSHGANALVMNDDYQTPLDVARFKGHVTVVRAIEGHVSFFSGWLRELHGPGFLELLVHQLLSRKVWVVVLPCGSRCKRRPLRLELAIYSNTQDAQPRTIVPLWKANLEQPTFNQPDPVAVISHISRIPRHWMRRRAIKSSQLATRTRIKLVPMHECEKHQLQQFSNACKGVPQVTAPSFPVPTTPAAAQSTSVHKAMPASFPVPTAPAAIQSCSEDEELAMAINASLQSASHSRPPQMNSFMESPFEEHTISAYPSNKQSSIDRADVIHTPNESKYKTKEAGPSSTIPKAVKSNSTPPVAQTIEENPSPISPSSAELSVGTSGNARNETEEGTASSCSVCLDAPVQGACIPCGHMVGCMSCLNEIKAKKFGCPVCRSQIHQVIRIYTA